MRAREKGLALRSEIDPNVPARVVADSYRLAQVLTNLLGNALKFTHEGGVTLRVSLHGPASTAGVLLHFEVRDTGIGIPADQQAHIFQPFKQADDRERCLAAGMDGYVPKPIQLATVRDALRAVLPSGLVEVA